MELSLALETLNPSSSLHISLVFYISWLVNSLFCCQCFCWGCCTDRNSILWYLQCISVYVIDTRYIPCLNMLSGCLWGSGFSLSVSIISGIVKLWSPRLFILAPLSRQQPGKAPCGSDLFCHVYLNPHEPGSLRAELCASIVHSPRHQNGETLLSLLLSSLVGFWPLKLVCLGEFLHVCYCPGSLTTINICESQMCDEVQNPFLPGNAPYVLIIPRYPLEGPISVCGVNCLGLKVCMCLWVHCPLIKLCVRSSLAELS